METGFAKSLDEKLSKPLEKIKGKVKDININVSKSENDGFIVNVSYDVVNKDRVQYEQKKFIAQNTDELTSIVKETFDLKEV